MLQSVGKCNHLPAFRNMTANDANRLVKLIRQKGIIRANDLTARKIPRIYLSRLVQQGKIDRVSRGLYSLAGAIIHEDQSLLEASKLVPDGVICLLSALRFHRLTTQAPFEVWLAIHESKRLPRISHPPLRVVRFSTKALTSGVDRVIIKGIPIQVTNLARTIVDCFVYRHKIGLEVALEALKEAWRSKRVTMDELHRFAKERRMVNVMKPYLEAIV